MTRAISLLLAMSALSACTEAHTQVVCIDDKTRDHIRTIITDALDQSLKNHTQHMFEVWMKDSHGQPARAKAGMDQGIDAYIGAKIGIQQWAPPTC